MNPNTFANFACNQSGIKQIKTWYMVFPNKEQTCCIQECGTCLFFSQHTIQPVEIQTWSTAISKLILLACTDDQKANHLRNTQHTSKKGEQTKPLNLATQKSHICYYWFTTVSISCNQHQSTVTSFPRPKINQVCRLILLLVQGHTLKSS